MSILRNVKFSHSLRWVHQNVCILSQLYWCSILHQHATLYCHQHVKLFYTDFRLWWYLLWICHNYWWWTHGISIFLRIYRTIIVQTPCTHTGLSITSGIEPLHHFKHEHSFCVLDLPCTWCLQIHPQYLYDKISSRMSALRYVPVTSKISTSLPSCVSMMILENSSSKYMVGNDES